MQHDFDNKQPWQDETVQDLKSGYQDEIDKLQAKYAMLETAVREAIPYLRNCAEHHRDDSILEDKIIPAITALLDGDK